MSVSETWTDVQKHRTSNKALQYKQQLPKRWNQSINQSNQSINHQSNQSIQCNQSMQCNAMQSMQSMQCHAIHAMPCHAMTMPCQANPAMPCHAMLCQAISFIQAINAIQSNQCNQSIQSSMQSSINQWTAAFKNGHSINDSTNRDREKEGIRKGTKNQSLVRLAKGPWALFG